MLSPLKICVQRPAYHALTGSGITHSFFALKYLISEIERLEIRKYRENNYRKFI